MSQLPVGLLAHLSVDWTSLSAFWKEVTVHGKTASFYLPDCLQWAVKKSQTFFSCFLRRSHMALVLVMFPGLEQPEFQSQHYHL